jgi:hypothetical protein
MPNNNPGTLDAIGIELVHVFQPIRDRVGNGEILLLLAELGIQMPAAFANNAAFTSAITSLVSDIQAMPPLIKAIIDELQLPSPNYGTIAEKAAELVTKIVSVVEKFDTIKDTIQNYLNANPGVLTGVTAGQIGEFIGNFARNLLDYLLIKYLESKSALMAAFLEFFGIIEKSVQNPGSTNPFAPEFTRHRLHLDNLLEFFKNPAQLTANLYDWGKPNFNGKKMLKALHKIALGLGFPAVYIDSPTELDIMFLKIKPNLSGPLPGIDILLGDKVGAAGSIDFGNTKWNLNTSLAASLAAEAGLTIKPGGDVKIIPPTGSVSGDFVITFSVPGIGAPAEPYILIGQAGASRFEFQKFEAKAGAGMTWNGSAAEGRYFIEAKLEEGKIIIKPGNPDGFLAKILPPEGFTIDLDLVIGYSSDRGFYFDGSGGLEIKLPLHLNLGPLAINALTLSLKAGSQGIPIGIGADIGVNLGPFAATVENMGIKANFTFPQGGGGNIGFANLDIDFKPPTGVGLAIDAGVVKGGGFLSFDYEKGRYTGIVQLSIKEVVNVIAIGLITTKNPDGSPGFSMILLITAEFTPIQLGFGFTLNGVGGLVGVNRTMVLQALRDGVRTNALDNILFPSDPIANATEIIHDLETVFPQQEGRYVFGLMGKLGWGTPTLISLELGLMLEVPNPVRLAILGVIRMVIPTEDAAVLKLQVNFVGTIDFEAKYITFDASLYDSKLLIFTLEGDMALRIKWGSNSNFLFTVGGFHPDYTPPPLNLPALKRLSISLLSGNPRLRVTTYFALTSNTLQFGAGVDFYFSVAVAKVTGYLYFDALFQFNPFYFKISLNAGLSVYIFGAEVMTIQLQGILEGPTPWHITGRVKIKIFWVINVNVSVETTWGESKNTSLPDIVVLPLLREAILNKANWLTAAETNSAGGDNLVRIKTITNTADDIIAHPNQSLAFSQKVMPLDVDMARFGTQKPSDYTNFHLDLRDNAGNDISDSPVKEEFAPVSFFDINGSDKLKRPNFEKYNSGFNATGTNELNSNFFREREVLFEEIVIDDQARNQSLNPRRLGSKLFGAFVKNGAAAKSVIGKANKKENILAPGKVKVTGSEYAIVDADSLNIFGGLKAASFEEAQQKLQTVLLNQPDLEGTLNIVPSFETA